MKSTNSNTQNRKLKLLQEENDKKERNDKVDKLKEGYARFENGEITKEDFKEYISREIQVPNTEKIDKLLSHAQLDGSNFTQILYSLDILKKRPVEEKKNPYYSTKYNKPKHLVAPPKTLENEADKNYLLKQYSREFVSRNIDGGEFRGFLQQNGVNANGEAINKYIRATESGKNVKLSEMLFAILKHKDDTLDPTKVKFDKGSNAFMETTDGDIPDRSMIPVGKGQSQLMPFTKKKSINYPYNSLNSQKEVFDWEANELKEIKASLANDGNNSQQETPAHKKNYESHVFDSSPSLEKPSQGKSRTGKTQFKGTDFFTWNGVEDKNACDTGGTGRAVKRRNPNETAHEEKAERKSVKLNKMLESSSDNVLNRKK